MKFDIKKFSQNFSSSKNVKAITATVVILAILSFVFQAGVFVGFHKASFVFKNGDNFYKTFGERKSGLPRDEGFGGHGAIGKIIKINGPELLITGPDNIEKVIFVGASTTVSEMRENSDTSKLAIDQMIAVIGEPNEQGQISAKLIRILPMLKK